MKEDFKTSSIALIRWLPHSKASPDEHPTVAQTIEMQKGTPDQKWIKVSKIIIKK